MAGLPARIEIAALAVLLAATALAVAPALDAPFTFDEHTGIGGNRALRPGAPISAALAYRFSPDQARPLFFLSLRTDARLFGADPRGFRAVSLALHLACGLLVRGLLRRTAAGAAPGAALAGSAVFLLHPVQSESIIYVWARSGVLATLFVLAAVWWALAADGSRRLPAWSAALASAALALLSKEEAIVVPLLFVSWWTLAENRPAGPGLRRALLLAAPAGLFLAARALFLGEVGRQVYVRGVAENVPAQALVTLKMLRLFFLPIGQSVDHPVEAPPLAVGIAALAGCGALLAAALALARRGPAARAVAGGVLCAAAGSALYWIVPLPDLMSERRFYLPMAGAALAVAGATGLLCSRWPPRAGAVATALLPAATLAALLAPLLHARARVWSDPERLWEEAARQAPGRARPLVNLGVIAAERGDAAAAAARLDRAVLLEPGNPEARYNRGRLRLDAGDLPGAADDLEAAVRHAPLMTRAHVNLAIARIGLGDLAAAERHLRDALALDPDEPRALTNLAEVLRATGRPGEALPLYRRALAADPSYAHAAVRLGVALEALGDRDAALAAYREYLRRGPPTPADRDAVLRKIETLEAAPR